MKLKFFGGLEFSCLGLFQNVFDVEALKGLKAPKFSLTHGLSIIWTEAKVRSVDV